MNIARRSRRIVGITLLILAAGSTALGKYSGGAGEPNDPYQIATAADLIALGETPEDYDKHFILTADIDLDPNLPGRKVFDKAVIAAAEDPGSVIQSASFGGVFDGRGHTISHLTIAGHDCLGLFGRVRYDAEVRNVCLAGVRISGSGSSVGALAGENSGEVTRCCSEGEVGGLNRVGGLVGLHYWATMSESHSRGVVSGKDAVGGLIGENGVMGHRDYPGDIDRSYSFADVSGSTYAGGLLGRNTSGSVRQCYSAGAVIGNTRAGGLVGGGWVLDIVESFWDIETSGLTASTGGEGRTTAQMWMAGAFLDAGWDFAGESKNGLHETWQIPEGGGYPILTAFSGYTPPRLEGQGTPEEPYLISSAAELGAMVHYSPSANYRLTSPIDLSGIRWRRVVIPRLKGSFDGDGHTVSHLTLVGTDYLGLFGMLEAGANVKNLGIVDANVVGSGWYYVGGLVRYNQGSVTGCYLTGAVNALSAVGGLVGYNVGIVTGCYSTAAVSGVDSVGGLVALNSGSVTQCYSTGPVVGRLYVGGLLGKNEPEQDRVTACFWDTQTSGQAMSAGGEGRATAQMQTARTFLDAGWDFVGETANGTENVWWILEGQDYPRLWWERVLGDDFEDGKAGPLWFVYEIDPDFVQIREVNGRLETTSLGQAQDVDAIYVADGWRLDATKDFALRVDFHFSKQGGGDGRVNLGLTPSLDPEARQWAELEAGCFESGPFYLYEVSDGFWVREEVGDRSGDEGTLYLSYNPDTDELYFSQTGYGKPNAWRTVTGLLKGRWAGQPVYVILSGGSEGLAFDGAEAWLDNFAVDTGTILD